MEQIQVINNNGKYDCNIGITTEEWFELLKDPVITPPNTWKALLGFYNSPDHTSKCSDVNPDNPKATNPIIWKWAKKVQERLKRFQVLRTDGKPCYWVIPMQGYKGSDGFYWTVRPELVKAIEEKMFRDAVERYKRKLKDPEYWNGKPGSFGERFKWEAIACFKEHWDINALDFAEMFQRATSKTRNLLHLNHWYPRELVLSFAKYEPETIRQMFKGLFDESIELRQRVIDFIQKMKELLMEMKLHHSQDEQWDNFNQSINSNAVSTLLWLMYPDKYYKYAPKIYAVGSRKLGLRQYNINPTDGSVDSMLVGFAMYDEIRTKLLEDKELVNLINSHVEDLPLETDFEDDFHTATIDFGYFVSLPNTHLNQEQEQNMIINEFNKKITEIVSILRYKKNIILQGAPGTGKTYSTAAIALGILGVDVDFSNHKAVMELYRELSEQGRIFFTTFHQSMDYEDFVEGLKPEPVKESEAVSESGQDSNSVSESAENASNHNSSERIVGITYICKQGIFKKACQAARVGQEFSRWLDDFLNSIVGFENKKEIPTITGRSKFYVWWNRGNKTIFVRPVSSTYEPADRFVAAPNIEKIKLQATDEEEGKEPNYTFYAQAIINYVCNEYGANNPNDVKNNVVLIIDEINRGNVSKIFGELVTLLEADKRDDGKQESGKHTISVILPYSKERFSVPSNVYIIGTMNTTDRSTGTLDYAIRRRFAFVTLSADPDVVPEGIAREIFNDIKKFIEDKDHHPEDMDVNDLMVGHSYFMPDNEVPLSTEEQLKLKIKYEVAPLLREYLTDGLLTCSQKDLEERIKSWVELKTTYKKDLNAASAASASESETTQSNE